MFCDSNFIYLQDFDSRWALFIVKPLDRIDCPEQRKAVICPYTDMDTGHRCSGQCGDPSQPAVFTSTDHNSAVLFSFGLFLSNL
jgi:hypothetical protein